MKTIYLDYAAATPTDPRVLAAMEPYHSQQFYNPSATYLAARAVRHQLSEARAKAAGLLGARPAEIVFTSGATESNNLAIQGVLKSYPQGQVLVSAIEHSSVLKTAQNADHQIIPVTKQGIVDVTKLEKLVTDKTVLLSVMLINNALGTIQPISDISQIVNKLSKSRMASGNPLPIYLHTDAAQAGNFLDLHTARLGVDLLSLNGGKIYGPRQSGLLYVKAGTSIQPIILGGGQEFGLRSGTESVAASIGLATALELAQKGRRSEAGRLAELRQKFISRLIASGADVKGHPKQTAPHIVSAMFQGIDNERLMMQLDESGVVCGIGSACSASSEQPSHTLKAIGLSDDEARSCLRFSFGKETTEEQLDKVNELIVNLTTV